MDDIDLQVAQSLLLRNPEIFKHYFTNLEKTVSANHDKAKEIFKNYNYPLSFEKFVEKYQKWCEEKPVQVSRGTMTETSSRGTMTETSSRGTMTETSPQISLSESAIRTIPFETNITESAIRERSLQMMSPIRKSFESVFRHAVLVVPPQKKRKREKEMFDIANFLVENKRNNEAVALTFLSDEEVQEEILSDDLEKKKISLLFEGFLEKIADLIELLNLTYNFRILDIHYED